MRNLLRQLCCCSCLAALFLLASCNNAKNDTARMTQRLKVLILGNSITYSAPQEDIGWYGAWGMAASSEKTDFVHVLREYLEKDGRYDPVSIVSHNINGWERTFRMDSLRFADIYTQDYDVVILRLGENVDQDALSFENYESALTGLIDGVKGRAKVIITGTVWQSHQAKDAIQEKVAGAHRYTYVSFDDMKTEDSYFAYGLYVHPGVAAHPSDRGMARIAGELYRRIAE